MKDVFICFNCILISIYFQAILKPRVKGQLHPPKPVQNDHTWL